MSNISLTLDESTATAMHSFMAPIARLQSCHVTVLAFSKGHRSPKLQFKFF